MITTGNAGTIGRDQRGWFVGGFMGPPHDDLRSKNVEIKWGVHATGEARTEWADAPEGVHTVSILVRGRFLLTFRNDETLLEKEGDFVRWGPGEPHTWRAIEDSVVVTIRWTEDPVSPRP